MNEERGSRMNRIGMFLAAVACSASVQAAGTLKVRVGPTRTYAQLAAQVRQSLGTVPVPSKRRRNAIAYDLGSYALLLPGAGNLAGSNGTYFRSDVMLVNYLNVDQDVAITWLAQGADNSNAQAQIYTIPKQSAVALDDFVGQTLQQQGLGAVAIVGVNSSGNLDVNADIDATSRIWTPQPGGAGTTSLQLAAVTTPDLVDNPPAYAFGLKQTAGFHSNVGIVNLDGVAHTFTVGVNGQNASTSFNVTVSAASLQQVPLPDGDFGDLWLSFVPEGAGFFWSAYGVSDDNTTGDGWASHAHQP